MYGALIAHLRECAKLDPSNNTYEEAADAIEALNDMAAEYKAAYVEEHDRRIAEAKRFQDGIVRIIRNVVEMRPFGVLERKPVDMEDGK